MLFDLSHLKQVLKTEDLFPKNFKFKILPAVLRLCLLYYWQNCPGTFVNKYLIFSDCLTSSLCQGCKDAVNTKEICNRNKNKMKLFHHKRWIQFYILQCLAWINAEFELLVYPGTKVFVFLQLKHKKHYVRLWIVYSFDKPFLNCSDKLLLG